MGRLLSANKHDSPYFKDKTVYIKSKTNVKRPSKRPRVIKGNFALNHKSFTKNFIRK